MSNISKANNTKPRWSEVQVAALIDAYKGETCLYATDSINYHNKHLRGEAIDRICQAVKRLRPTTDSKECYAKFHNLRTEFNIEHTKLKASQKSGVGTDDIYKPTKWYYNSLLFLANYLQPRKSRNSLISKRQKTDSHEVCMTMGFRSNKLLCFRHNYSHQ
ncbi:hypothetical protein ABEB36_006148 [Hypothenemus hampei]|uniref:MADF domain-containing protein n=1 Tax=Hypothenemus hampei TaxID=57062 RepID=A0ABD1F0M6_HYPHA